MKTNFTKNLQSLIETSGKNQNLISKELNIPRQRLSNWKTGYIEPNIDNLIMLADYFDVSIDELVGLTDNPKPKQNATLPAISGNAVSFVNEFEDIIPDKNYISMSKLFKAIAPELRALVLGYAVGLLQNNGVNTKNILGY